MPTVCWKPRPPNIGNMFSIKNSSIVMISVSESVLVESEWVFFFTKSDLSLPRTGCYGSLARLYGDRSIYNVRMYYIFQFQFVGKLLTLYPYTLMATCTWLWNTFKIVELTSPSPLLLRQLSETESELIRLTVSSVFDQVIVMS